MATASLSDEALLAFFHSHPNLRDRVISILGAVENSNGDLGEADAAEERLVEEMRLFGREALQGWADKRIEATERDVRGQAGMHRQGKKTPLAHETWRNHGRRAAIPAQNQPRAPLCPRCEGQPSRMFAAFATGDHGFRSGHALRPGPVEIARALRLRDRRKHDPEGHSGPCQGHFRGRSRVRGIPGGARSAQANRRANRRGHGPDHEAGRGTEGQAQGEEAVVEGGEDLARARQGKSHAGLRRRDRRQLFACAVRAGFGSDSRVHAVGDGAPWIVGQIEDRFGEQGSYLLDFYHVCEYLNAAAKTIVPAAEENAAAVKAWMETQKDALKTGRVDAVLGALFPHREALDVSDEQAPVRLCHRYLGTRKDQLQYAEAIAEGLPIGSGEIESAHRCVAQKRLKLPGAWWLVEHAEHMLALRINRLNGDWEAYWAGIVANTHAPANLNQPKLSPKAAA